MKGESRMGSIYSILIFVTSLKLWGIQFKIAGNDEVVFLQVSLTGSYFLR